MPWSEWIQSEPYGRTTPAKYRAATQSGRTDHVAGDLDGAYLLGHAGLYADDATTTVYATGASGFPSMVTRAEQFTSGGSPSWTGGIVQTQVVAWFDTDSLDLATWRQWQPPELGDLTEGVDYTVRPDRTGSEDDAFIEYEEGSGELTGWSGFISGKVQFITASQETSTHATARWRLLDPPPTVPATPAPGTSTSAPPLVMLPTDGSSLGAIVNGVLNQTTSVIPTAGPSSEIAILVVTDDTSDPVDAGGSESFVHEWGVSGVPATISAQVLLPRWRYWIPGTPPLRIRQRGDGLSIETTRLRNRASRQTTNRLRGFD